MYWRVRATTDLKQSIMREPPPSTTAFAQERVYHGLPPRRSACDVGAADIRCGINVGPGKTVLDGTSLESRTVATLARQASAQIRLSEQCRATVRSGRERLDDRVRDGDAIYGATTGVGGFAGWLLSPGQAAGLQRNLIAAVASNMGPYLPDDAVRAAMLARINVLARGHSAIRLEVVDHLKLKCSIAGLYRAYHLLDRWAHRGI
jgi:hypothetical protein